MPELTAWLIRHGESTANIGIHTHLPAEIPLTEKGQQQAQQIAEQIISPPRLIIVSPFQRTHMTAAPLIRRWPDAPVETWPIQELIYLVPAKFQNSSPEQQLQMVDNYWQRADPFYCDGEGAETFAEFISRVQAFQQRLFASHGFVVVVGHGHFLKAFQLGLEHGFMVSSAWMRQFRAAETAKPITNGEIIKLGVRPTVTHTVHESLP